ncbi:uncharacterized protein LOC131427539 [Malaya genurostris]|uniref:uncharacterized protein LOC131427539 n=1 Tax=Malaya genurostris TaxID=325434 RepID=UPI0026F3E94F|nr:uncharacterized protein LOC131427539 [Malaya genurostris]
MNEYLWEFAQKLPSENRFQIVLKSALSTIAAKRSDLGKTNDKWMCRKCKTLWMHGYFHVDEIQRTNKFDKLVPKYEIKSSLSRKQQTYLKYMQSRKNASIKYTCHICSYKTRVAIVQSSRSNKKMNVKVTKKAVLKTNKSKSQKRTMAMNKKKPASTFNSNNSNKLQALSNILKNKSVEMSSQDRLKLLLK